MSAPPLVSLTNSVNTDILFLPLSQGLHDQALEDCEKALQFNQGNYKALYRKARSLKEMGRLQEAYEAVAKCSLAVPQVSGASPHKGFNEVHFDWLEQVQHTQQSRFGSGVLPGA